jgi:hypothetical protein
LAGSISHSSDADTVGLRIDAVAKIELTEQFLGQRTAAAFGKNGLFGMQFHARLEVMARLAILANTEVAGSDALDRTILMVKHLGRRKSRVNLDTQRFGLLTQPAARLG